MKQTKLPERWRKARNIDDGYEIRYQCPDHGDEWYRVTTALHMLSPLRVTSLTLAPVGEHVCLGGRRAVDPVVELFSRRPAVSDA